MSVRKGAIEDGQQAQTGLRREDGPRPTGQDCQPHWSSEQLACKTRCWSPRLRMWAAGSGQVLKAVASRTLRIKQAWPWSVSGLVLGTCHVDCGGLK